MTAVFQTPDGTPTEPQDQVVTNAGMSTIAQQNPGHTAGVYANQGVVQTPMNISGWTVQNAALGSDQHLETRAPEAEEESAPAPKKSRRSSKN